MNGKIITETRPVTTVGNFCGVAKSGYALLAAYNQVTGGSEYQVRGIHYRPSDGVYVVFIEGAANQTFNLFLVWGKV